MNTDRFAVGSKRNRLVVEEVQHRYRCRKTLGRAATGDNIVQRWLRLVELRRNIGHLVRCTLILLPQVPPRRLDNGCICARFRHELNRAGCCCFTHLCLLPSFGQGHLPNPTPCPYRRNRRFHRCRFRLQNLLFLLPCLFPEYLLHRRLPRFEHHRP